MFVYRTAPGSAPLKPPRPTLYLLDLRAPSGYFLASRFPIWPEDVVYVSNAPSTDLAKFLAIIVPPASTAALFSTGLR